MSPYVATLIKTEGGRALRSPTVGIWRDGPEEGELIRPGQSLGYLSILGTSYPLLAPEGARGIVKGRLSPERTQVPVDFGSTLFILAAGLEGVAEAGAEEEETADATGLVFKAPSAGRFYSRSAPDKPAFVSVGATVKTGQTVFLLEVMKTFTRVAYQGPPAEGVIKRVLVEDGDDVVAGQAILELEDQ